MNTLKAGDIIKVLNLKKEWVTAEVITATPSNLAVKEVLSGDTQVVHHRDVINPFKQADRLIKTLGGIYESKSK